MIEWDDTIKQILSGLGHAAKSPVFGKCPNCPTEIKLPPYGQSVNCPGCQAKLVRPRPLSFEHLSVITQYAPTEQVNYWIQRASAEGFTPERLAAEIKYTARQHVYGSRSRVLGSNGTENSL